MFKRFLLVRMLARRFGPWAWGLLAYDVWKRLSPERRQQLIGQARRHGPKVAEQALKGLGKTAKGNKSAKR